MQTRPSSLHLPHIGFAPSHLQIRPLHVAQPSFANPSKRRFLLGGAGVSEPRDSCEVSVCSLERNGGRGINVGRCSDERSAEDSADCSAGFSAGRPSSGSESVDDDEFVDGLVTDRELVGTSEVAEGGGVSGNVWFGQLSFPHMISERLLIPKAYSSFLGLLSA